jgi:hypothetical protein
MRTRRLTTWAVAAGVCAIALVAIIAALKNGGSSPRARAAATPKTATRLCDLRRLSLSIRSSGFLVHIASLRLRGSPPCDVGHLTVTATVVDRKGGRVPSSVASPGQYTGQIQPDEEMIATFRYDPRCGQKPPLAATVVAQGEIGSIRATAPVAFRYGRKPGQPPSKRQCR